LLSKTLRPVQSKIRHSSRKETQTLTITQPWLRLNCSLGEGPFWEEDTNTLRFLDVEKQRVHRVDLNVGASSHKIIKEFDISIGYVAALYTMPPDSDYS
jgi:sugar lactone lactonase YvrE